MLVLVCGLPATGKSTVARNIARKLKAAVLRTDIIRKQLFEMPTYTSEEKKLVYKAMFLVVEYLLRSDRNVVLDGTFYKRSLRHQVYDISKRTGAKLVVIECKAPGDSIKRRMDRRARRKNEPSDADHEIYKKIKTDFEPIKREHIALDTEKSPQSSLEEALRYLMKKKD
ncbi:MAG: AAA family ATPase [Candidatus Hydrothermarchaeaceae archaeon]